jgi:hypothetical protein
MFFTVIQYLPILEEETPGHRVELVKKTGQDDETDGNDGGDDDDSPDEKTNIYDQQHFAYFNGMMSAHLFYIKNTSYLPPVVNIHTPPPKI